MMSYTAGVCVRVLGEIVGGGGWGVGGGLLPVSMTRYDKIEGGVG